jgi:hypothetical protein
MVEGQPLGKPSEVLPKGFLVPSGVMQMIKLLASTKMSPGLAGATDRPRAVNRPKANSFWGFITITDDYSTNNTRASKN